MAITQDNTLEVIELAENNIPVTLTTDNFITTAGAKSYIQVTIPSLETGAGKKLELTWDYYDIIFTTAVTPDGSGLQIPQADGYGTVDLWVADIIVWIRKNENLFANYEIWATTNIIHLAAINSGLKYKIKVGSPANTITHSSFTVIAAVDEVRAVNFSIILSVYIFEKIITLPGPYTYDEYKKIKTMELEPLDNSKATFFLEGVLQSYFINDVLPMFNLATPTITLNLLLKYYYRYSEKLGDPPSQTDTTQSGVLYALNGGVNRKDFDDKNFYTDIINNATPANSKFLSWHPLTKELTKEQHDYLYYVQTTDPTATIFVKYKATLIDGSVEGVSVTITGIKQYESCIIPVGYIYVNSLAFSLDVASYSVQIFRTGAPEVKLTEARSYTFKTDTPLSAKYFLFKNSLGVYESICFTGERINGVAIKKLTSKRIINFGDDETVNENITSSVKFNKRAKIYTGFKNQTELDYFIEFLKSKSIYEQMPTYYKPVFVNREKITLYKDKEFLNSASVEVIDNTENNYSNA